MDSTPGRVGAAPLRHEGNQLEVELPLLFTTLFDGRKSVVLFPWDRTGDGKAPGRRLIGEAPAL